jgi:ribosomal protein S17
MNKSLWMAGLLGLTMCAGGLAADQGAKPASAAPADRFAGKVVETMNAATYTYVQIDTGAAKVWAAAPQFSVKVGDTVTVADAMPMRNYQSKTLNRTFDVVYFSGNVVVNGAPGTPTAASATKDMPKGHPAIPAAATPAGPDIANIKKAENGQTVAEIVSGKATFAGKPIAVRARVVKFNAQILGKNWLHVRDGSGAEGTNDLTVTTAATAKVGDLVVVTGTLATDRDFGSGYKYPLIVEDAKVVVQ